MTVSAGLPGIIPGLPESAGPGRVAAMESIPAGLWTDCHNHLQLRWNGGSVAEMLDALGIARCVVNATREADWDRVAAMAAACPNRLVAAYGIHPWHAAEAADGWEERLHSRLTADPRATLGECGLDGLAAADPAVQRRVFLAHLRIARDLGRGITVHCVRAWGGVLDALTEMPPPALLMHGYGGSAETAARLVKMGAYFSCNARMLGLRAGKASEVFRHLPLCRMVVETDSGTEQDGNPARIAETGTELASLLAMGLEELRDRVEANVSRLFAGAFGS